MRNIKNEILNAIPENDYQVLNCSVYMGIIKKYGYEEFHAALNSLHKENKITFNSETDGLKIFRV